MGTSTDVEFLIIGQGLAGSLLAIELLERGHRVLVVDDRHESSSTKAAAGLINPVTGQRLVLARDADKLIPAAIARYRSLEKRFGTRLYTPRPMARMIRSDLEFESLAKRRQDRAYHRYLGEEITAHEAATQCLPSAHGSYQKQTGNLDPKKFLAVSRTFLIESDAFREGKPDARNLRTTNDGVAIDGINAKQIIFCEGYRAQYNPWFDWLPFQPAKGEILTLKNDDSIPGVIINYGHWLLPINDRQFKFGATYDWKRVDCESTEDARNALLDCLRKMLPRLRDSAVVAHKAGVRPATEDKQPFIGLHPANPRIGIFNGFGSRGSLLAPWFAERFADVLTRNETLPSYADIKRYAGRLS